MKKIMTFAIMALFLGFAFNANAQVNTGKTNTTTTGKETKTEDWEKVLKEYEQVVDQCVTIYNSLQNAETGSNYTKEFDKCLAKAESLKTKIEKSKNQLTRSQVNRFNQANQKLSKVYIKR